MDPLKTIGLLTLKNTTMNTMLTKDCQALLIIYINNKLVGGTSCWTCGTMMDMLCLYFIYLCDGTSIVFYSSLL
jgi:hypothetical protein